MNQTQNYTHMVDGVTHRKAYTSSNLKVTRCEEMARPAYLAFETFFHDEDLAPATPGAQVTCLQCLAVG